MLQKRVKYFFIMPLVQKNRKITDSSIVPFVFCAEPKKNLAKPTLGKNNTWA